MNLREFLEVQGADLTRRPELWGQVFKVLDRLEEGRELILSLLLSLLHEQGVDLDEKVVVRTENLSRNKKGESVTITMTRKTTMTRKEAIQEFFKGPSLERILRDALRKTRRSP